MPPAARKPIDPRIPALINATVASHNRSLFVLVGSPKQQHAQLVNLHYLLSTARLNASSSSSSHYSKGGRPSVLWTYKKEMAFTGDRKKREGKIRRDIKRGTREEGELDPFELFLSVTDIRYCYYKETEKILGRTFGMLVLQDFEAITPNLLARTIETVEGGGIVVLLLQSMTSLRQLYTMSMDVHSRYRTDSALAGEPIARFNERFILSLGGCDGCLVLDDELNVLPLSKGKDIAPSTGNDRASTTTTTASTELTELKSSLTDTPHIGAVIAEAKTLDQAQAVLTFTDAIASKTLSQTVALTAARGRGKSAALGLSIALAIAHGYANVFVTSPSPENLKTLFDFVFKGLEKLGYEEHLDYDIVQSSNADWKGAVVRVNIFRDHRQTIQPQDSQVLGQAELVVIDEAAAIPLPLVRNLLGPYLVFMASTINGYEGTGRSLSLKLLQQLRESAATSVAPVSSTTPVASTSKKPATISRSLREISLTEPIRYSAQDQIESWLNKLLCLDATVVPHRTLGSGGAAHPSLCELFMVDRDTLFSYHPASEAFLQRMMALYVASHYKNSPNDLQLMSDAPAHSLFVLLPPLKVDDNVLPDPLVVIQVALEGAIGRQSVLSGLGRGVRPSGDLIPWTITQQFQDDGFASLSGARIVRIAVHPDYAKMGYGTRALEALDQFYSGQLLNLDEVAQAVSTESFESVARRDIPAGTSLQTETIKVRSANKMPPLLHRLGEIKPDRLDYIGTSYGLTANLLRFWKRAGYVPLYLRQTQNDLTGEHTCIMIRGLSSTKDETAPWLTAFAQDFRRRFINLLSFKFRDFGAVTCLSVLEAISNGELVAQRQPALSSSEASTLFTPFDMKRLQSYADNTLDWHIILDLLPSLATLYFTFRFPTSAVKLSAVQQALLLGIGLQHKSLEQLDSELNLHSSQCLALFGKVVRKLSSALEEIRKQEIGSNIPLPSIVPRRGINGSHANGGLDETLEEELRQEGDKVTERLREEQRSAINSLPLDKYAVTGDEQVWNEIEARGPTEHSIVTVQAPSKREKKVKSSASTSASAPVGGKKRKGDGSSGGRKKSKKNEQ